MVTRSWSAFLFCALICALAISACGRSAPTPPNRDIIIAPTIGVARTVVIFVHGVLGNSATTFRAEPGTGWPELLATDPTLPSPIEVISLAYDSPPLNRSSNINEIATRLHYHLRDLGVFERFSTVIFVTHSMGGLVTRRLLLQLSQDVPQSYAKVAGIFFLATPAGGSDTAGLASWVSGNPQFDNMAPEDINVYLQADGDDWATLLRRRSAQNPYPRAYCVYEKQAVGSVMIVPRSRSQAGCDERPIAFERNHINLVKPKDRRDDVYAYVSARIKQIMHNEFVPLTIEVTLRGRSGDALPSPVALRSGEQYALQIHGSKPAWFYVVSKDSQGKVYRFFPSQASGGQTAATADLNIPEDTKKLFTLDRNRGIEMIYVFASGSNDQHLAELAQEISTSPSAQHDLDEAVRTRGTFVAAAAASATNSSRVVVTSATGEPAAVIGILHQ